MAMAARQVSNRPLGDLVRRAPLAKYTVWGIGGVADALFKPADLGDLRTFLADLPNDEPVTWLGLGSNVLIRDGGVAGTVILTTTALSKLAFCGSGRVRVEAGVPCPKVARFCARSGLTGCEFFAGIPGTVGGALRMNAGAFGGETWAIVASVETVDAAGRIRSRDAGQFKAGYRSLEGLQDEWFVAAVLQLEPGDGTTGQARIRELLKRRADSQPTGQRSCGSVFRNPPGDYAARLIDVSGLKGVRVGGAQVSRKHANFIINLGTATADDVETLIARIQATVVTDHGVELVPEVLIIGRREQPGSRP